MEAGEAGVGGERGRPGGGAEIEGDAAEEPPVVGEVAFEELGVGAAGGGGERARGLGAFVAALAARGFAGAVEAGGGGEQEGDGVGAGDGDRGVRGGGGAALGEHAHEELGAHALGTLPLVVADGVGGFEVAGIDVGGGPGAQHEGGGRAGGGGVAHGAVGGGAEADAAGAVGGEAHDEDLVGVAAEHLAREGRVAHAVAHGRDGAVEVERAGVVLGRGARRAVVEGEAQVAERQVGLVVYPLHFFAEPGGGDVVAREEGGADLGEGLESAGVVPIARSAGPEGGLVQLEPFAGDVAEHHGAEAAVAHGEGLGPGLGRAVVAQHERGVGGEGGGRGGGGGGHEREQGGEGEAGEEARGGGHGAEGGKS